MPCAPRTTAGAKAKEEDGATKATSDLPHLSLSQATSRKLHPSRRCRIKPLLLPPTMLPPLARAIPGASSRPRGLTSLRRKHPGSSTLNPLSHYRRQAHNRSRADCYSNLSEEEKTYIGPQNKNDNIRKQQSAPFLNLLTSNSSHRCCTADQLPQSIYILI